IWLLFTIAFGSAGVLRHATWLVQDPQPWYQIHTTPHLELRMAEGILQILLVEHDQDLESTRKALAAQTCYRHAQTLLTEEFNFIFYSDKSNRVVTYLIVPRNPRSLAKGEFQASSPGASELPRPISELHQTLAELDTTYQQSPAP